MEDEYVIIDNVFLRNISPNKFPTNEQLKYLGFEFPTQKGWRKKLLNSKIKKTDVEFLYRLKYMKIQKLKSIEINPIEVIYPVKTFKPKKKVVAKPKFVVNKSNSVEYINPILGFILVSFHIEWADQYNHPNWQRMRMHVLNRDNFKCVKCGNEHSLLHVHHKRYSKGFIWEIEPKYLITLCDKCHLKAHNKTEFSKNE